MASKESSNTNGKSSSGENSCSSHPNDKIQMYCVDCDKAVCHKCIAGCHTGHHFDVIENIIDQKRAEITSYTAKVEEEISSVGSAIQAVKTSRRDYSGEIEKLSDRINRKRNKMKQQIDNVAHTILLQLYSKAENDLKELNTRETILTKEQSELKLFLKYCRDKIGSTDGSSIVHLIEELKQKEKTTHALPVLICPPHFADGIIDVSQLRKFFGHLIKDGVELSSDSVESVHSCVKHTIDTTAETVIKPGIQSTCVATLGEDKAWLGYRYYGQELALVNTSGQVLQKVNLGFIPGDITTTSTGEILVTDYTGKHIKKYTENGKFVNIIYTSQYQTRGLYLTADNEILVCLQKSETDNKVLRVTTSGEVKQKIQHYHHHKPMFTRPEFVTENINKDVCVVDNNKNVVVVNKDGHLRFRYPNLSATTGSINGCWGIACDQLGFILLSDSFNHRIHLIDINGNFIQYLLTHEQGIMYPRGLSVNCKGELWVCNRSDASEVRVLKYRS